ncbi:MAG: HAMP domain-containing sensor histidine kinase [Clostridiaceae bacterium]
MKKNHLSVHKIIIGISIGSILTIFVLIAVMYMLIKNVIVIYGGLVLFFSLFFWEVLFLCLFQRKLSQFTDDLCRTLDNMINGNDKPEANFEEESLFARISHRLDRLYSIMQANRRKVEEEKTELQILVSDISHQTKTPIANLKIINDTLLTRSMPEEKRYEFLQATNSQLDKLDFMIQALVKASRLETGLIVLEKKAAPIYETIVSALNGILAPLEKRHLNLTVNCPEELTVYHDVRWTGEALFNLLDNAVKYTAINGNIHVTVQEWEMYIKIDVKDTGKGIPESEQAAIFKRFYREETVHEIDGIGIGLYITREVITKQGGYIRVISAVDKGTTFSVFLPKK